MEMDHLQDAPIVYRKVEMEHSCMVLTCEHSLNIHNASSVVSILVDRCGYDHTLYRNSTITP